MSSITVCGIPAPGMAVFSREQGGDRAGLILVFMLKNSNLAHISKFNSQVLVFAESKYTNLWKDRFCYLQYLGDFSA